MNQQDSQLEQLPFLKIVANQLYNNFKTNLHTLVVVFPNRRQGLYFQQYLQDITGAPLVLPELLTIEELVGRSSKFKIADSLIQSFALYEAYAEVCLAAGDSPLHIPGFDKFYGIAETLLKDFREIDNYLANVDQVYHVMHNVEAIDKMFDYLTKEQREFLRNFWAGTIDKSAAQQKFLLLWQRLPAIYQRFHQILLAQQCTTLAMAYRQLGEGNPTKSNFTKAFAHVAFVGFNAFNIAEENLILRWQKNGYCSLWFDADAYYINNTMQEAGMFLRRNLKQLQMKPSLPLISTIANSKLIIPVIATQGHTAQAKTVAAWLAQLPKNNSAETVGILLADETLLIPVLQSLPPNHTHINVTMGYPLQQTVVFSFIQLFFTIQQDLKTHANRFISHFNVERWLNHPFCDWPQESTQKLKSEIVQKIQIRVPLKRLQQQSALSSWLFLPLASDADIFVRLRLLIEAISKLEFIKNDGLLQGMVAAAWQAIVQADPLFNALKPRPKLDFVKTLLLRQLCGITVPFEGEPLQGIQIMGLLESRGLDFDHLLILGASEGTLPRIKAPNSYLPDNVRRAFGLPALENQDAIFAYVFYRLLHRSKSITLVYNAQVNDNSTGELSRFAQQLAFETGITLNHQQLAQKVLPQAWPAITIPRSEKIQAQLFHYLKKEGTQPLSPSAINTWITCRLQFFFKYIARLKAPKNLSDGVDAAVFGNIVHKLMERLYKQVLKIQGHNAITESSIDFMRSQVEEETGNAFSEAWQQSSPGEAFIFTGELLVIKEVVMQYAHSFLEHDASQIPFTIQNLEVKFSQPFAFELAGKEATVLLSGIIDRIDEKNGVYRMLDYKTGGDNPEFKSLEGLFDPIGKYHNKAVLQTLLYSWMFSKTFPERKQFEPALVAIRKIKKGIQLNEKLNKRILNYETMPDVLPQVALHLQSLLEALFDPKTAFDQTDDLLTCKYCDFNGICGRA